MIIFLIFIVFIFVIVFVNSWIFFFIFCFLIGIFVFVFIVIVLGIIVDIFFNFCIWGRNMGLFFMMIVFGFLFVLIILGYCFEIIGWRWVFWIGFIYVGCIFVFLFFFLEIYGFVFFKWCVEEICFYDVKVRVVVLYEMEKKLFRELMIVVLYWFIKMFVMELIVNILCVYFVFCYVIFYMCFEVFLIIFIGVYGFLLGECGLMYLVVGVGCLFVLLIFFVWDSVLRLVMVRNKVWIR